MSKILTRRAFATSLTATPAVAIAGRDLQISPTTLNIGPANTSAVCSVWNNGTVPTSAQVRMFEWTQKNGQDALNPTDEVAASPPTMTVAPHDRQIVRIVNLSARAGTKERAFRLMLNELPSSRALSGSGVQVLIAFSVPVFMPGVSAAPPRLSASIARNAIGRSVLRIHNHGDIHARLVNLVMGRFTHEGLVGYVLPGTYFDVDIPEFATSATTASVNIQTSARPVTMRIGV